MLNFDRFTVKHGTQNIQNYCDQWLSDSFRVHQIRFRLGLRPRPHWGNLYSAPTYPLAGLRSRISKRKGKRGRTERKRRTGEEGNGRDRTPSRKLLDPPLLFSITLLSWFWRYRSFKHSNRCRKLGNTLKITYRVAQKSKPLSSIIIISY